MSENARSLLLDVRAVSKSFGGLWALDSVDLQVPEAAIVGLIGPNGSGKTTLFNVVTGIYHPTAGNVLFQGRDISRLPIHAISRAGIARTFQQIRLFLAMSAIENVLTGLMQKDPGAWTRWLRPAMAGLADQAESLIAQVGLKGKESLRAGALAYGEQRRLELARALATRPHLLLLDEPVAGMNPGEIAEYISLLRQIKSAGTTILFIEHHVRTVMSLCDPIYVLNHGRRIAEGCPRAIQSNEAVIRAYLGEEIDDA